MRLIVLVAMIWLGISASPTPAADPTMSTAEREAFRAEVHDYLLDHPEVLKEMIAALDARERAASDTADRQAVELNARALFADGYSYVGGNPDGDLTLVEFLDYQCGYCRKAFPEIGQLIETDGNIRFIVKDFPILGPGSELAARAATAAMIHNGPEAYARLHDRLMQSKGPVTQASLDGAIEQSGLDPEAIHAAMNDPEVDRRLAENLALGRALAISGTPTFVFSDRMVRGYVPLSDMRHLAETLREPQ